LNPLERQVVSGYRVTHFPTRRGLGTRDVAVAPDGAVWFNGQFSGTLGHLDPRTGIIKLIPLGKGSSPHGIIFGPDGNLWITDGGLNAIVRVNPRNEVISVFPLPPFSDARSKAIGLANLEVNLNTLAFDGRGKLWFTGQNGVYGRFDPQTKQFNLYEAPLGSGPYGISSHPSGDVWFTNWARNYIGRIDAATGALTTVPLPDPNAGGARRIWSDSRGRLWVSTWISGSLQRYDPATQTWRNFKMPGLGPRGYSVYVDQHDYVWVNDFTSSSVLRFDQKLESFVAFPSLVPVTQILQMNGSGRWIWGAEQGTDRLVLFEKI
jgi:virginiamycin B lyase